MARQGKLDVRVGSADVHAAGTGEKQSRQIAPFPIRGVKGGSTDAHKAPFRMGKSKKGHHKL